MSELVDMESENKASGFECTIEGDGYTAYTSSKDSTNTLYDDDGNVIQKNINYTKRGMWTPIPTDVVLHDDNLTFDEVSDEIIEKVTDELNARLDKIIEEVNKNGWEWQDAPWKIRD